MRRGRRSSSRHRGLQLRREATRPHRRHAAARRSARRRGRHHSGGARRIADDILAFARANNVTQIVIGKSTRSRWFEIVHGSVVHDLVRRSPADISVHVIAGDEIAGEPVPRQDGTHGRQAGAVRSRPLPLAALAVAVALGRRRADPPLARHRERRPGLPDARSSWSRCASACWPSLFASVAASLCYNFFFLPPLYTFTIADPNNVAAFVLLRGRGGHRLAISPRASAPRP